jgi:hypothetical protein
MTNDETRMTNLKTNTINTMQPTPPPTKKTKAILAAVSLPAKPVAVPAATEPELIYWSEVLEIGRRARVGEHTARKLLCLPSSPYATARIVLKGCGIARYNRRMVLEAMGLADSAGPVR